MKKIVILLFAVCFGLASCSNDENNDTLPADGQYIAEALDLVVSMDLNNGICTQFTVYICGEYFNQWSAVSTTGSYPKYKYRIDELEMLTKFSRIDSFDATLSGLLTSADGSGKTAIDGHQAILFQLDNRVLDANDDGILDSKQ